MKILLSILALPLILGASTAFAQNGQPSSRPAYNACKADAQQLCQGVQPGAGRIMACLKDHYKDVSEPCYNAMQSMAAARSARGRNGGNGSPTAAAPAADATPRLAPSAPGSKATPPTDAIDAGTDDDSR